MLKILLSLIFIRPFLSSLAFPSANLLYSFVLLSSLCFWTIARGVSFEKIRALSLPLLFFILALFISAVFSYNNVDSLKELYKYISSILILLFACSLNDKEKGRVVRIITLTGLFISFLAIYQYLFGFRHLSDFLTHERPSYFTLDYIQSRRVFLPFITPNTLAGYLVMIIPLALVHEDRIWLIIPLSCAFLLTRSLGALLSILLVFIIYRHLQGKLEKRVILASAGILFILAAIFILRLMTDKPHLQPLFSTTRRLGYWKDTLGIIKIKPLIGIGLGNFDLALSRYSHNSYLQVWAEIGILGLIGWLGIIFKSFQAGLKKLKEDANNRALILGLLLASSAFLIHNMFDFSFFLPEVSLIWWIIVGLTVSKADS